MPGPLWELLRQMSDLTPPVFVMGGCAEDLLLGDELDQPHKDLDLLAPADALAPLMAQMPPLGLGPLEVVLAGAHGPPLMLRGPAGRLEVEIYAALPAPDGFSIEVPAQGPAGRLRLFLPPDTFSYPATLLADLSIQTVSPLALALMRAASAQTRHVGESAPATWLC